MPAIFAKGITKKFGSFVAVDNVDLIVEEGEVFGFLGANGAGKTTTIKMLIGLIKPTSGSIIVSGIDVVQNPQKVKEIIGYMSQKFSLYDDLTVEENINFFGGIYGIGVTTLKEIKEDLLTKFNLLNERRKLTKDIPLGLKQRLALGIALMHRPKIVFLDEPTSGADPISRRNFWEIIRNLKRQGVTVFVTTHYLEEAEYCSKIALINSGRIIAYGTPTDLKKLAFNYPLFEVDFGGIESNIGVLNKVCDYGEFFIYGRKLHFLSKYLITTSELGIKMKSDFGIAPKTLRRIIPTLDDVFFQLVQKSNND
ncbi:MAG: ABC transporter ATP-binding protein [Ignavibacteria bacterium]|nr:ABC transporter ATP-binding protein [Ignavibacteria bacterium]